MKRKLLTVALLAIANNLFAQWTNNSAVNSPVCVQPNNQTASCITSSGGGSAIFAWVDVRNSTDRDVYVQKVNSGGIMQWTLNGIRVSGQFYNCYEPAIISDGAGGAFITWADDRNGTKDIYVQKVNSSGSPQWTANGVLICSAIDDQTYPALISDGSNGVIICWYDARGTATVGDVYAQRVNASGVVQWATDGVNICNSLGYEERPKLVTDGSSGAILAWGDKRGSSVDIYAQRINSSGNVLWTANGVKICDANNDQHTPDISVNGSGGAIITWEDMRGGIATSDIYAQAINSGGTVQWASNGVGVCTANSEQHWPKIVSDGGTGAIISWYDSRSGITSYDIYAQKISSSGTPSWTANGVAVCSYSDDQTYQSITSDGSGGAVISWYDDRNGGSNTDIYAQKINSSGVKQWTSNGVVVTSASNKQEYPHVASDGSGGAIVVWDDKRTGTDYDIYTQQVLSNGNLSVGIEDVELSNKVKIYPNPTKGIFMINGIDSKATIIVEDVFGNIVSKTKYLGYNCTFDLRNQAKGVYTIRIRPNKQTGTETIEIAKKVILE